MSPTAGNYAVELEVATRAVLEAGRVLRDEFHRPGGPRGGGGHALADEQAESLIRQALTEAFPDYACRGEETGFQAGAPQSPRHTWLVDPNDGTSAYLKGFRGAAVSIALLCEGQPVLGVVYAYCAPDDRGDLFSWAQGAGPLQRNGQPVSRQWPASLDPSGTVLVSHHADRNPLANAHAARPLRFRAIPGIAYRLALVAAGEGELGVSLNGPCGWDYAGGHALLRGAGGELCDGSAGPSPTPPRARATAAALASEERRRSSPPCTVATGPAPCSAPPVALTRCISAGPSPAGRSPTRACWHVLTAAYWGS